MRTSLLNCTVAAKNKHKKKTKTKKSTRRIALARHDAPRLKWNKVARKYSKGILEVTECILYLPALACQCDGPLMCVRKRRTCLRSHQQQQKKSQTQWLTIFGFCLSAPVSSSKCLFVGYVLIQSLCCDELRESERVWVCVCVSLRASPPCPMACRCPARRWGRWLWPQRSWRWGILWARLPSRWSSSLGYLNLVPGKKTTFSSGTYQQHRHVILKLNSKVIWTDTFLHLQLFKFEYFWLKLGEKWKWVLWL